VATVMSNLGFRRALEQRGIEIVAAPVGDKFVVEAMLERSAILGGEQSGHIIFGRHAATGDGILAALQVAQCTVSDAGALSKITSLYSSWPQVLVNVRVASNEGLEQHEELWREVADAETALGDEGRVLLRASGTEPVVRVMVEASEEARARATAHRLANTVRRHLGNNSR
jgi:phosphoglucosamine mutase